MAGFSMSNGARGLVAAILFIALFFCAGFPAHAQTVQASPQTNSVPQAAAAVTCGAGEYPVTENGKTVCKLMPKCEEDPRSKTQKIMQFDTSANKFVCKDIVRCNPDKGETRVYVLDKNTQKYVYKCQKPCPSGSTYYFNGTELECRK